MSTIIFMRPIHWLVVLVVVILLFGAAKLPDLARNLGKSAKILKKELQDINEDTNKDTNKDSSQSKE